TQAYVNALAINAALVFYALTLLRQADQLNQALIGTMMPHAIAERLKSGEERIADRVEMLSVMFADLVGFTEASHDLSPESVVHSRRSVGGRGARLGGRAGRDKVNPTGHSYRGAPGLAGRKKKAASAVGPLALAIMERIGQPPPLGGRKLRLRVGIHCGPATA